MNKEELKELLDEKYVEYCKSDLFIHTDPIQIPKAFEEKEDIEIAGFLAASLAWGQRPTIIKKCRELMSLMDYAPHDFVMNATEEEARRGFAKVMSEFGEFLGHVDKALSISSARSKALTASMMK